VSAETDFTEHRYFPICDQCVAAEGSECHEPGCALWLHDVPSDPLDPVMALSRTSLALAVSIEAAVRAGIEERERELASE
jgi:hypothetical protein